MAKLKDYTEQRFGKITALEATEDREKGYVVWKCKCDCGKVVYIPASKFKNRHTLSCGCDKTNNKRKQYSLEDKMKVINFYASKDVDYNDIAEKFNIPYDIVYRWIKNYEKEGEEIFQKKRGIKSQRVKSVDENGNILLQCTSCGAMKLITEYHSKSNGRLHEQCKECKVEYRRKHYDENKDEERTYSKIYYKRNKEKIRKYAQSYREEHKAKLEEKYELRRNLLETLKLPCFKCNETRKYLIQFHHIDPKTKAFNISNYVLNGGLLKDALSDELNKCVCLCSNCHDEFHWLYGKNPQSPNADIESYLGTKGPYYLIPEEIKDILSKL